MYKNILIPLENSGADETILALHDLNDILAFKRCD